MGYRYSTLTFPLHLLIATVALTTPPEIEIGKPPAPVQVLQVAAVGLEILDRRECHYYLADDSQLEYDLMAMRRRFAEVRDAPPLCDAIRFPSAEYCREMRGRNYAYEQWLLQRLRLFPHERWITEAIIETNELWRVWDAAGDCQSEYSYIYYQRYSLKRLRSLLGEQLYYAGCLPAPIPGWRLFRID